MLESVFSKVAGLQAYFEEHVRTAASKTAQPMKSFATKRQRLKRSNLRNITFPFKYFQKFSIMFIGRFTNVKK